MSRPRAGSRYVRGLRHPLLASALAIAPACGAAPAPRSPPRPAGACPIFEPAVIRGPEDVARLAPCASLPGLTVGTAAAIDLARLTALTRVRGDLRIGPTLGIATITLPALVEVTGTVRVAGNGDLTGLFLPALARAGAVELADDPSLASVSAPALATIDRGLSLARVPALELVDTSAGPRVGGELDVAGVPALVTWLGPPAVTGAIRLEAPRLDDDTRATIGRKPDPGQ